MSAYTVCVTGSGLPLLSRKKGNSENVGTVVLAIYVNCKGNFIFTILYNS